MSRRRFTTLCGFGVFTLATTVHATAQIVQPNCSGTYCTVDMGSYAPACNGSSAGYSGKATYTVCNASFNEAVADAKTYFSNSGYSKSYQILIDAGTYDLTNDTNISGRGVIDVSGIMPDQSNQLNQELIIQGAGQSQTFLTTSYSLKTVVGEPAQHVIIRDMHLARDKYFATQGVVKNVSSGNGSTAETVTVAIDYGFPTPDFPGETGVNNRVMRLYNDSNAANPTLITATTNAQITWLSAPLNLGNNQWQFTIATGQYDPDAVSAGYTAGSYVCVKAEGGSSALFYFDDSSINGGSDIQAIGLSITQDGRMVFGGISNVNINHVTISRGASILNPGTGVLQAPCLSTDSGGLQIGATANSPGYITSGNVIQYFSADALGDDQVAFFGDAGGTTINGTAYARSSILNSTFTDGFARMIFVNTDNTSASCSWSDQVMSNTYVDCPVPSPGQVDVNFSTPINFHFGSTMCQPFTSSCAPN